MQIKSLFILIDFLMGTVDLQAQGHGIVNNSQRPYVAFRSIDIGDCQWTKGCWADKTKSCKNNSY